MFCKNCGFKVKEGSQYCINCGVELNQTETIYEGKNQVRKAIKNDAKQRSKGILGIGVVILAILMLGIESAFYQISGLSFFDDELPFGLDIILTLINVLISTFLMFGIVSVAFDISRNKQRSFKNIFARPIKKFQSLLYIIWLGLPMAGISMGMFCLFDLLLDEFSIIVLLGSLTLLAIWIYLYPMIDMFFYTIIDEKVQDKSFISILKRAYKITKGHRVEYYAMGISFVGWHVLSILTFGILYIWTYPYIILTTVNLYKQWSGEISFKADDRGISNEGIVGTFVGIVIVITLLISGALYYVDQEYGNIGPQIDENAPFDGYANLKFDNANISFKVPDGFYVTEDHDDDYQEYDNRDNDYIIYGLQYTYDDYYETEKKMMKGIYDSEYPNNTLSEYTTTINGIGVKVFYIDFKYLGFKYRVTKVFYPVTDKYFASITIGIEGVTKDNLGDYLKIKDAYNDKI